MNDQAIAVTAWEALFRAQVSVMRYLGSEFPAGDLSLNEYDVLFNLSRQPERRLRLKDLGEHLLITQPSVSRLVDRLVARGLLAKSNDPTDARGVNVNLTERGYELFRQTAKAHMASIQARVGSALSTEELITLAELCDKLRMSGSAEPGKSRLPATASGNADGPAEASPSDVVRPEGFEPPAY